MLYRKELYGVTVEAIIEEGNLPSRLIILY
jgi:hypothetical protein